MTSATTQPSWGTREHRAAGHGYGLVLFTSVLLVVIGPFWSLMIIAADVVALYGLCAYGSRANLALNAVRYA
jgi:hypothetical protein